MLVEAEAKINPILEVNRVKALANLETALATPEESALFTHQQSMLVAYSSSLARGERSGYMSEPTGSGKSAVMAKIAEILGLRTIILSPTVPIMLQTAKEAKRFAPTLDISNFYGNEKDISGVAVNTTYQSMVALMKQHEGKIREIVDSGGNVLKPEDVGLVICDEAHLALGETRHGLYRQFPNALLLGVTATPYFAPIEGYRKRKMIGEAEEWIGLFSNLIHKLSLEEAIERGILTNADIYIFKTRTQADSLRMDITGDFSQRDLEKYFAREQRNVLITAMVAGIDSLPKGVALSEEQRIELEEIHRKVASKKTLIFGISIDHIEGLAKTLRELGIKAAAVHSKSKEDVEKQFDQYRNGELQVLLGVDMLGIGVDLPPTETTIHAHPSASGVVITQEFGRGLRNSPETGKEKLIAIQLVDQIKRGIQPVLIPQLFSPDFLLMGSQRGRERKQVSYLKKQTPSVVVYGMDIDFIVEQARSQELIVTRFEKATASEMSEMLDRITVQVYEEDPTLNLYSLLSEVAARLPGKIPQEVQFGALKEAQSDDNQVSEFGRKALMLLNLKTILSAVDVYYDPELDSLEKRDEILTTALVAFSKENIDNYKFTFAMSIQLYNKAVAEIAEFLRERYQIPPTLSRVSRGLNYRILRGLLNSRNIHFLTNSEREEWVAELIEQTGVSRQTFRSYMAALDTVSLPISGNEEFLAGEADGIEEQVMRNIIRDNIEEVLAELSQQPGFKPVKPMFSFWDDLGRETRQRFAILGINNLEDLFRVSPQVFLDKWDRQRSFGKKILADTLNEALYDEALYGDRYSLRLSSLESVAPPTIADREWFTRVSDILLERVEEDEDREKIFANMTPLEEKVLRLGRGKQYDFEFNMQVFTPEELSLMEQGKNLAGGIIEPVLGRARRKLFLRYHRQVIDFLNQLKRDTS